MNLTPQSFTPHPIPPALFRENRQRLGASLLSSFPNNNNKINNNNNNYHTVALLSGGSEVPIHSTDCCYLFQQESYFYYLFGVGDIADCLGVVGAGGRGVLAVPRYPEAYAVWMGALPTLEALKKKYEIEEVCYVDELGDWMEKNGVEKVQILNGINSDSGLEVMGAKVPEKKINNNNNNNAGTGKEWRFQYETDWLYDVLSRQRMYKTALEAEVLRYVCRISSEAHIEVMRRAKNNVSQHQLEADFLYYVYHKGGCRKVSYTCICATGAHGAVLHYPHNDAPITDGEMALLDMGGQYKGYASDITCSFPINGKFNTDQKMIYEAVLDAHDQVMRSVKPGVSWVAMHRLALRVMGEHLIRAHILIGTIEEIMEKEIMGLFQPHGLGHLIGLDVHDVGGYLKDAPERPTASDCSKLRTARVLEKDFYMTIEPGCYINPALLEGAFKNPNLKKHLNEEKLRALWHFGGVRIESDVLITENGAINFTVVPRTVEEIERTMAGEPFHKEIEVFAN